MKNKIVLCFIVLLVFTSPVLGKDAKPKISIKTPYGVLTEVEIGTVAHVSVEAWIPYAGRMIDGEISREPMQNAGGTLFMFGDQCFPVPGAILKVVWIGKKTYKKGKKNVAEDWVLCKHIYAGKRGGFSAPSGALLLVPLDLFKSSTHLYLEIKKKKQYLEDCLEEMLDLPKYEEESR